MNKQQVRNFNLFTIQYPFTAIISLLHRLSGIFAFLLIPFLLWMLDIASGSSVGFERLASLKYCSRNIFQDDVKTGEGIDTLH